MKGKFQNKKPGAIPSAGERDPTFGDGGIVRPDVPGYASLLAHSVALLGDNRMIVGSVAQRVAEATNDISDSDFLMTWLNDVSGSLDQGHAFGGHVTGRFSAASTSSPAGFLVLPDEKVLMYGESYWVGNQPLASLRKASLAMFLPDGTRYRNWGINGAVAVEIPGHVLVRARPFLRPGDALRLVGAGYDTKAHAVGLIVDLDAQGRLDSGAGGSGCIAFEFPGTFDGVTVRGVNDAFKDDQGRFVVAGSSSSQGVVARIDADGIRDLAFGDEGLTFLSPPDPNTDRTAVERIVSVGGGRMLCVGWAEVGVDDADSGLLAVLTDDGHHDPFFNGGSPLFLTGLPRCRLTHAAVDTLGRYVVAGKGVGAPNVILVARFLESGTPDT
jgi:hypothetical protein